MAGRLRKDFMKDMAMELEFEEWTRFGLVENAGSPVDKRNA